MPMRRPVLLFTLALTALSAGPDVRAQQVPPSQAPAGRLTPRSPPTAILPKATPVHAEPKGRAPAGVAVLRPLPVLPVPLSAVTVPGEPPTVSAPASAAAAPPPPAAAAPAKPEQTKPALRTAYAKEGIYIRATPSRGGRVLDTLEAGETVQLLPDKPATAGWVRVARNGKPLGWVSSAYLAERGGNGRTGPARP